MAEVSKKESLKPGSRTQSTTHQMNNVIIKMKYTQRSHNTSPWTHLLI